MVLLRVLRVVAGPLAERDADEVVECLEVTESRLDDGEEALSVILEVAHGVLDVELLEGLAKLLLQLLLRLPGEQHLGG